ncbi:uncharacterized protein TRIADDRAFT_27462 [Trichoplax adhaerens]|uniref:Luciferin 4-monooxygenase n=1 Tax=Trichoplax adhaerens TaxID=10228 RepID=B3S1X1_TRIAD|nr:hypothetical protein TRIADDRAFT_27462 [Trichoplax adhaerens]EDV23580.1 hypothetical protein TRIADDRAFT_27462 [Trichoplax adhaerens]|eukprot:XP_002114490.1 hypothetical protein TRIADDRAFT_27462 [Trichoplax adhaerens]
MYISSTLGNIHIPDNIDFYQFIFRNCDQYYNRIALIDDDKEEAKSITYGELRDRIERCCSGLIRLGLQPKDVVMIRSPNCLEFVIGFFAVIAAGGIVTTCNPIFTEHELARQLNDSKPAYIITHESCINTVKKVNYSFRRKIVIGKPPIRDNSYQAMFDLINGKVNKAPRKFKVSPKSDVAVILYSSGTTGLPKGVMLSHYNLIADMVNFSHRDIGALNMDSEDECLLNVLPLFHVYGLVSILSFTLCNGRRLVLQSKFIHTKFLNAIQEYKVTKLLCVPAMVLFLAKSPLIDNYNLSSLTYISSGGAPVSSEIGEDLQKRLKLQTFNQGYGMTELGPLVVYAFLNSYKVGSVGKLVPNTDCKVINVDNGEAVGLNEVGELCFRGPQMMLGYINNPQATADTIDKNGWLHTGDIGYYDNEGNVFVIDRLKELIKFKGFQIAPAELEAILNDHQQIADSAVIGIPDETAGEVPKAYVVLRNSKDSLSAKDIIKYVAENVAWYKQLRGGVEFVQSIPKSASGKILRRVIRQNEKSRISSKL